VQDGAAKGVLCLMLGGRAPRPDREPYTREVMADKGDKPKAKKVKAKKDDKGVLAALPATRPERIGTRRAATAPKSTAATSASKAAAKGTAPKRKPAARKAAAKPRATATAARRKAAAPRTFEPTQAAETAAGAADERAAGAIPRAETRTEPPTYPRPQSVRAGAPGIGTTGYREQPSESGRPSGTDLAATAVKAAGQVAQLGLTIGGHVLKRVAGRLPKP